MAENCGGTCSITPVKRGSSARTATARAGVARLGDAALGVVGVALLAPAHGEAVALAAVHDEGDGLGGLAKSNGQGAGGQRIEGAGVAGALGVEQPLHHRDRVGRGHADRLVEHHPAVDVAALALLLGTLTPGWIAGLLLHLSRLGGRSAGIARRVGPALPMLSTCAPSPTLPRRRGRELSSIARIAARPDLLSVPAEASASVRWGCALWRGHVHQSWSESV